MTNDAQKILDELKKISVDGYAPPPARTASQIPLLANLLVLIAEDMDRQTRRIIRLTWGLLILTAALLFFTIVLYKDAHEQTQHDNILQNDHAVKAP